MGEVFDIIVVGAGIAGAAAATTFARQGYSVLLLERSLDAPDRIVGELLQPGGVAALEELGLATCLEGLDSVPVRGYRIYWKGEEATFYYPSQTHPTRARKETGTVTSKRKSEGRSFHHGKLVSKLRAAAKGEARITVLERTVTGLLKDEGTQAVIGVECLSSGQKAQKYRAKLTVVADGCSSNFRSQLRQDKPQAKSRFWGLELLDVEFPIYGLAYGIIGSGGPVLIYQISPRTTRILIDIPDTIHQNLPPGSNVRSYIRENVVPALPEAFRSKVVFALSQGRLRSMPNQWFPSKGSNAAPGVLLLGDASNMRHPLTGGGMTVALKDVLLLRSLLNPDVVDISDRESVLAQLRIFHWRRKAYSAALNILAQALYTLFVADDPQLEVMQRGFVRYIQQGPQYYEEPAGIMGGVIHNPLLLFYHFFGIALYSMWLLLLRSPAWLLPLTLCRCTLIFWRSVSVILPYILSELWQ